VRRALEGVRVLDMTHVQSGASCAQILPGWAPTWSNWRLPAGTSRASRCVTSPTSTASTSRCSGCPIKLSDSPVDVHRSPLLGETNEDINGRELGRDDQLASLKAKGVI
jgi:crotonobetainyl-CoA:carnitine CoA-transferase CaiB-like acyl-CoA transferase